MQDMNNHDLSWIRNRSPSNKAAPQQRLKPHRHRDWSTSKLVKQTRIELPDTVLYIAHNVIM